MFMISISLPGDGPQATPCCAPIWESTLYTNTLQSTITQMYAYIGAGAYSFKYIYLEMRGYTLCLFVLSKMIESILRYCYYVC